MGIINGLKDFPEHRMFRSAVESQLKTLFSSVQDNKVYIHY